MQFQKNKANKTKAKPIKANNKLNGVENNGK